MLSRVDPGNDALDGGPDLPMRRSNFEGEGHAPTCPTTLGRDLCKAAEPIEILFELWTRVGPRKHVLGIRY